MYLCSKEAILADSIVYHVVATVVSYGSVLFGVAALERGYLLNGLACFYHSQECHESTFFTQVYLMVTEQTRK